MKRELLDENTLSTALETLKEWSIAGSSLKRRLAFHNFAESLDFVNRVGALADEADHHPDISFGWGYAELLLTTHDRGGITDVDIALAKKIDKLT